MKKKGILVIACLIVFIYIFNQKFDFAEEINLFAKSQEDSTENDTSEIKKFQLDVPLINQMEHPRLYNGCEVTSLAMLLNYHGIEVTKNELAEKIAKVPLQYDNGLYGNPNVGFVGNMEDGPGLAVYHEPIYQLAVQYAGKKVIDLTGEPFEKVIKQIQKGLPVWVIVTNTFQPVHNFQTWDTPQGEIQITFSEHSVVITGFDQEYLYLNNPYGTKNQKVDRQAFIQAWEQMGKQAIVITK